VSGLRLTEHRRCIDRVAPWSGELLRIYPVSTRVNAVRNDDASVSEPIEDPLDNGGPSPESEPSQPRLI